MYGLYVTLTVGVKHLTDHASVTQSDQAGDLR